MLNRRNFLTAGLLAAPSTAAFSSVGHAQAGTGGAVKAWDRDPFRYCLNTSTIRGQKLGIVEEIAIAAKAGYQGIEPWINELDAYTKSGGTLRDLKNRLDDSGLKVESAIGFAAFLVDDEAARAKGFDEAKRCMDLVAELGATRIAAPPVGVTNVEKMDLAVASERFRQLVQLGASRGVLPQLELWGFSKSLSRLGEVAYVATEAGAPEGLYLLDIYHIYKGGSGFGGLEFFRGDRMQCFHVNDYPSNPQRAEIKDEHRVFPGDGVAPLSEIFTTLAQGGYRGVLSLELFNKEYWSRDALAVASEGLQKTKAQVAKALKL